jgi:hypothetical protein
MIESIFNIKVTSRFTEIFFKPEFKLSFFGREKSIIGKLDAFLGGSFFALKWLARQQSFLVIKND